MNPPRGRPHPVGLPGLPAAIQLDPAEIQRRAKMMGSEQDPRPPANKEVPKRYTPLGTLISGWADPPPDMTDSGISLGGEKGANEWQTTIMNVIAVGREVKYVKPGDRVLVSPYAPIRKVFMRGEATLAVFEDQVIGIVDPTPDEATATLKAMTKAAFGNPLPPDAPPLPAAAATFPDDTEAETPLPDAGR